MTPRAQTESIGVILLTAVVVVTVGAAGTVVLADAGGDRTTRADLSIDIADEGVSVAHNGGESVPLDSLRVVVRHGNETWRPDVNASGVVHGGGDGQLDSGDRWVWRQSLDTAEVTRVQVFDHRTNTLLAGERRYPTAGIELTPTATSTGTATRTETPTATATRTPEPDTKAPSVTVDAPDEGDAFVSGKSATIEWTAIDTGSGVESVDIEYSADNGSSWNDAATGLDDTGSYDWTVPDVGSDEVLVRVTATDGAGNTASDVSDGTFTISRSGLTALSVSDIVSGESGEEQTVSFTVVGDLPDGETVTVELSDAQAAKGGGNGKTNQVNYYGATISGENNAEFTTQGGDDAVITFTAGSEISDGETITFTITGIETADDYTAQHSVPFERSDAPASETAAFAVRLSNGGSLGDRSGDVYVAGDASVQSDSTIDGSLNATGSVTLNQRATVTGNVSGGGSVTVSSEAGVGGNLTSGGSTSIGQRATVDGTVDSAGDLSIGAESQVG